MNIPTTQKRERPSPRKGMTWEATVGGQKIFLRSGEYEDGTLCEIWVTVSKQGTLLQAMLDGFAIALSLALQHGVPLQQYIDAYRHTKFDPCGPVSGDPQIKWASSLFDYIIQRLELTYGEKKQTPGTIAVSLSSEEMLQTDVERVRKQRVEVFQKFAPDGLNVMDKQSEEKRLIVGDTPAEFIVEEKSAGPTKEQRGSGR